MNRNNIPGLIKKKQQRNLILLGLVAISSLIGFYYVIESHDVATPHEKLEKVDLATPLDHVDAQSIWIERAQNQLLQERKAQNLLTQQLQWLQKGKTEQDKSQQQIIESIQMLQNKLASLQQQIDHYETINKSSLKSHEQGGNDFINNDGLTLLPSQEATSVPDKNPETFVPAGTFVRAITLGGADTSAGVTSQGNPSPILFRILDQGTLPNNKKSHLKNCVATAAAIGDISSERGEVRLERLSCMRENGELFELPVAATVFGPDGKNGVRGVPLWREGTLLARAFAAGALSGISHGIAQSYTSNAISPWGAVQSVDNNKIAQYGFANGVGNAAEKLADYNIKRAELYHPVIQLSAGTVVDIVFLKGFYLHNENQEKITSNNRNLTNAIKDIPEALPLTQKQIDLLKKASNGE